MCLSLSLVNFLYSLHCHATQVIPASKQYPDAVPLPLRLCLTVNGCATCSLCLSGMALHYISTYALPTQVVMRSGSLTPPLHSGLDGRVAHACTRMAAIVLVSCRHRCRVPSLLPYLNYCTRLIPFCIICTSSVHHVPASVG